MPPPGFATPQWDLLAEQWDNMGQPAHSTITLGPETVVIGHNDPEVLDEDLEFKHDLRGVEYGWDNEHPERPVEVQPFRIEWRPVSNGQFYEFYEQGGKDIVKLPASWVEVDGQVQVRVLYLSSDNVADGLYSDQDAIWPCTNEDRSGLASAHFLRRPIQVCSSQRWPPSNRSGASAFL